MSHQSYTASTLIPIPNEWISPVAPSDQNKVLWTSYSFMINGFMQAGPLLSLSLINSPFPSGPVKDDTEFCSRQGQTGRSRRRCWEESGGEYERVMRIAVADCTSLSIHFVFVMHSLGSIKQPDPRALGKLDNQ